MSDFSTECEKAHGSNWRKWLGHLKDRQAVGIEIGTWKGESAAWMLENIFTNQDSRYICIDTFDGSPEHHLAGITCENLFEEAYKRLEPYKPRSQIHVNFSHVALRKMTGDPFADFVYVDAAHDAMNVLRDSVLAFDLLKVGGIMIWDDYEWSVFPDKIDCPKLAVDSFLDCYARQLEVVSMGWQVCVRKVL